MIPAESYGFVVPVDDSQQLREALEGALKKEWDRTKIREWAHSRSWGQVGAETVEQLRRAVEKYSRDKEENPR